MTCEEIIEEVIQESRKAYRNNYRNCPEGIKLMRHEPVMIDGIEFTCWAEYTVYKMGQYIREVCPDISVYIELDGNDSTIRIEAEEQDEEVLAETLKSKLGKVLGWK